MAKRDRADRRGKSVTRSRAAGQARSRKAQETAAADEAGGQVSEAAQAAARQARRAARSLVSEVGDQVRGLMDRQVELGADLGLEVADAVRAAAERLEDAVSPLAGVLHGAADRIDDWSDLVRESSAGDLLDEAQDFVRRRPAVVFGAAAAAGFLLYRLMTLPEAEDDTFDDGLEDEDLADALSELAEEEEEQSLGAEDAGEQGSPASRRKGSRAADQSATAEADGDPTV